MVLDSKVTAICAKLKNPNLADIVIMAILTWEISGGIEGRAGN